MGIDLLFALIVGLGTGIYMAGAAKVPEKGRASEILECRSACGKDRVKSYDFGLGLCECIDHKE